MQTEKITDETIIHFGQYMGTKLGNVPDDYLLFLHERDRAGRYKSYIIENLEAITKGAMKERKQRFKGNKRR
jgi:uncharacterized protein (DUF3820 family)